MRRKDREINTPEFYDLVFSRAETMSVAFRDDPYPYCQTFNIARTGNYIYIHSAREGRKLDLIRRDPRVAFCLASGVRIDRDAFTTYYNSLCGEGRATIVEDEAEKMAALDAIGEKYAAKCPRPSTPAQANRVAVIKIEIAALSGKKCEPKA